MLANATRLILQRSCEFIAEARRVARLGKTRIHVIYQRSDKYVVFGVSTSD